MQRPPKREGCKKRVREIDGGARKDESLCRERLDERSIGRTTGVARRGGESEGRRDGWRGPRKRDREGTRGTDAGRGWQEGKEGDIPGARRRRARVEKRVRAAHYARDASRGPL